MEIKTTSNKNMSDSSNKKAFQEGSILRVYNLSPLKEDHFIR